MSIRKHVFEEGEYYHIYNRGNSKQKIFHDEEDYERFIKLLYICNSDRRFNFRDNIVSINVDAWEFERGENLVSIGAWVLMPNHFHIYLTSQSQKTLKLNSRNRSSGEQNNNVSVFMQKLGTAYVGYYNKKYKRTGSVFEGKFKSVHVESDAQARHLFSYIHMNPLKLFDKGWKEKIKNKTLNKVLARDFLDCFQYSSLLDYGRKGRQHLSKVLNKKDFPDYFSRISFSKLINFWIESEF